MADENQIQPAATETVSQPTAAAESQIVSQPSAPSTPVTGTAGQPAQTQPQFSLRDYISEELGNPALKEQFQDDQTLARQLAQLTRQAAGWQQQAQLAQRYLPHAEWIEKAMAEREAAAQAEQAKQAKSAWNAPPYDPRWREAVNPDGTVKPGYDPTIPQKLAAWYEHQRNFMDKMAQNPAEAILPTIKDQFAEIVESAVQKHLGGFRDQQLAQGFVSQNAEWLFEQDPVSKAVKLDPFSGQQMLSPAGQRFRDYVIQLEKAGISNIAQQQTFAQRLVEADLFRMAYTQQKAGVPTQAAAAAPGVNRIANALGNGKAAAGVATPGKSLRDMLTETFAEKGITDKDIVS